VLCHLCRKCVVRLWESDTIVAKLQHLGIVSAVRLSEPRHTLAIGPPWNALDLCRDIGEYFVRVVGEE
jgi:hypothetical protein